MARAKKLPSGTWRVLVYDGKDNNGKRKYISFTAPTAKEANYLAAEYQLKRKKTEIPENMTVGEAIDRYIESKSSVLSPSTVREYICIRRNGLQNLMNIQLNKVTQELIQREINQETINHSAKSVKNMHGLLSATLKVYLPSFNLKTTLPQKEKYDIYIPSTHDIQLLLKHTENTELHLVIMLAFGLGLRRSEISGLTWECIDLRKKQISIKKAKVLNENNDWIVKSPKSYSGNRILELPNFLIDELSKIPNKKGEVIKMKPSNISNQFAKLVKKLGLSHFRFHDLRHYNASIMLALNIPDKYAMERMGHASNTMLKTVYQHTIDSKKKEISITINNYFDEIMQHEMQHKKK